MPIKERRLPPITVQAGGIQGGECEVDGSISSQFISSLLIACTKARKDTVIKIKNPSRTVSEPYIDATLRVLRDFGFKIRVLYAGGRRYREFRIPANQVGKRREFSVPGDMSSAAAIIGATLCASGKVELRRCRSDVTSIRFSDDRCGEAFGAGIKEGRITEVV